MKPDYKNWIPKGMLVSLIAGTVLSLALLLVFGVFGVCVSGKLVSAQFDGYRRIVAESPDGILRRKQILANGGEYCDYFITGNRE